MSFDTHKPASVGLAQQTFDDTSMICRALTALIDGTEDEEAMRFIRGRAALGRPDRALAEFMERREAERSAALARVPEVFDSGRVPEAEREAKYKDMLDAGLVRHWREL